MGYAGSYADGYDNTIELDGLSADDIERDHADLDECFGIAESMREYQEDEELTEWIRDGAEKRAELKVIE
jgi:hypothetical protein